MGNSDQTTWRMRYQCIISAQFEKPRWKCISPLTAIGTKVSLAKALHCASTHDEMGQDCTELATSQQAASWSSCWSWPLVMATRSAIVHGAGSGWQVLKTKFKAFKMFMEYMSVQGKPPQANCLTLIFSHCLTLLSYPSCLSC